MIAPGDDAGWRDRAAAPAGQIADAGVLTDPRWRAAIEQTPRQVFVPRFYRDDHTIIDGADPGGRIVTDLRAEMSSSLAVLDKTGPDAVTGRLLEQPGHFMWLRPDPDNPLRDPNRFNFVIDLDTAETTTTNLDPHVLDEPGLRLVLGILEPTLSTPSRSRRNGTDTWSMHAQGGCWVEVADSTVTQGGPRHLWSAVEHATTEWRRLGQPGRGRFGLTATTDGIHHFWLDTPDHPGQRHDDLTFTGDDVR